MSLAALSTDSHEPRSGELVDNNHDPLEEKDNDPDAVYNKEENVVEATEVPQEPEAKIELRSYTIDFADENISYDVKLISLIDKGYTRDQAEEYISLAIENSHHQNDTKGQQPQAPPLSPEQVAS
jgi:hypothetical protein